MLMHDMFTQQFEQAFFILIFLFLLIIVVFIIWEKFFALKLEKNFRKVAITNFVKKNYSGISVKDERKIIDSHLKRCFGTKKGFVGILTDEGILIINRSGNLFDCNEVL